MWKREETISYPGTMQGVSLKTWLVEREQMQLPRKYLNVIGTSLASTFLHF
jgi:hypothetical protein